MAGDTYYTLVSVSASQSVVQVGTLFFSLPSCSCHQGYSCSMIKSSKYCVLVPEKMKINYLVTENVSAFIFECLARVLKEKIGEWEAGMLSKNERTRMEERKYT